MTIKELATREIPKHMENKLLVLAFTLYKAFLKTKEL